jgi:hypothetical protein
MARFRNYAALFLAMTVLIGVFYWLRTSESDWWAFRTGPTGPIPKFKFTLLEQLVISGLIGALIAVPAMILIFFARLIWKRRHYA